MRAQSARRPNVIFILADDLGYGDLGCYGQTRIATPNIDKLAAEGVRFTQAYAGAAECAPSRCVLMTGKHTGHATIRTNGQPPEIRPSDVTFPELLKRAGYRNALIGKWSLGGLSTGGYPTKRGFDYWYGFFNQNHAHNYYPELLLENDREVILKGNTGTSKKEYVTDVFTDKALKFIDDNRSRPFFLKLAYTTPHTDNELARDTGNGMAVPNDAPYTDRDWPQPEKNFAAMITGLDAHVRRIVSRLKELGLDENTVIFFTSDNGPHNVGGHSFKFFASGGPLRGMKFQLYEGGIRVPMIVRWPGRIAAGRVSQYPWTQADVFPTLMELCGGSVPDGIDGISVLPEILGKAQRPHPPLYWEVPSRQNLQQAIRDGDWKAVRVKRNGPVELYNLKDDPGEARDVASANAEVVKRLESLMVSMRTECAWCRPGGAA